MPFQRAVYLARVDGQLAAHLDLAFATHHALQDDVVGVGVDVQGIANAHRLNQKAQFGRQFFAHPFDAVHQLTAGVGVDQGNQAVANFQTNQIHLVDIVPIQFFHFGFGSAGGTRGAGGGRTALTQTCRPILAFDDQPANRGTRQAQGQKHQVRHTGHDAQQSQNTGGHEQSRGVGQL